MRVFNATAYDKYQKNVSFPTYLVEGVQDTDNDTWVNDQLAPYGITDDDVHYYFGDGEIDDCEYVDTPEFFYTIGYEEKANGKDNRI